MAKLSLIDAAMMYVARGWAVFPLHSVSREGVCSCGNQNCGSPGKHPLTKNGFYDASRETRDVAQWWVDKPNANIGIRTGEPSGLLVIDVDPRNGGDVASLGALPETLRARTGSGGEHLYFQWPGEKVPCGKIRKGIDLKCDGGYVVAPPSRHASGRQYEWVNWGTPVASLPDSLLREIRNLGMEPKVEDGSGESRYLRLLQGVDKGERDDAATILAGHFFAKGLSFEEVLAILEAWDLRNRPPLSSEDPNQIRKVVTSIFKRESAKRLQAEALNGHPEVLSMLSEEEARNIRLQMIREALGIDIEAIYIVSGNPPQYIFQLSSERRAYLSASDLVSQERFRTRMVELCNVVVKRRPNTNGEWDSLVANMLACAEEIDATEQATVEGVLRSWIKEFLRIRPIAEVDGRGITDVNIPFKRDGRIWIRLEALLRFVRTTYGERVTQRETAQILRSLGSEKRTFATSSRSTINAWDVSFVYNEQELEKS